MREIPSIPPSVVNPGSEVVPPTAEYFRYFGMTADRIIDSSDLDDTLDRVTRSLKNVGEFPANAVAAYAFVSVPVDYPLSSIKVGGNPTDQFGAFERLAGSIDDAAGDAFLTYLSLNQFRASDVPRAAVVG